MLPETLSDLFLLAALGALLPCLFMPLFNRVLGVTAGPAGDRDRDLAAGLSLIVALSLLLMILGLPSGAASPAMFVLPLVVAALLGLAEHVRLIPAALVVLPRLFIGLLVWKLGFGIRVFLDGGVAAGLANCLLTVAFVLGVFASLGLIDRMRGLAPGVAMILGITLFSLSVEHAAGGMPVLALCAGTVALGLMFAMDSRRRLRLGSTGQLLFGVVLVMASTAVERWGVGLTAGALPAIALAVPICEAIAHAFRRLSHGARQPLGGRLSAALSSIGVTRRWIVFFLWLATLQASVLMHLLREVDSPMQQLAAVVSVPLLLLFILGCLLRLAEKLEARTNPGRRRILFLTHYFTPEVNAPATRLSEHAATWIARGHQVTVICPAPSAPHGRIYDGFENGLWQEEEIDGVRTIRVWTFLAANRGTVRRIINYVSFMMSALTALLFVRRHDVIVATTPQFFCGLAGAVAKFFRREKFILEVRDIWPESVQAVGATERRSILGFIELLAGWMYRRADALVTVGDGYRDHLLAKYPELKPRISVIPNGIDFDMFDGRGEPDDGPFTVSYIGTTGLAHGLSIIPETAALMTSEHVQFLIVGEGAEFAQLRTRVREQGLGNVVFTGLLPKRDIPGVFRRSHACLVHLRREPIFETVLPSKLFEAMAMKRAVLLGVRGCAERIVGEAQAGIVFEQENAQALAQAIRELQSDEARRRAFGDNGRRYVERHYRREHFAAEYLQVISSLLEPARLSDEIAITAPAIEGEVSAVTPQP